MFIFKDFAGTLAFYSFLKKIMFIGRVVGRWRGVVSWNRDVEVMPTDD